LPEETNKLCEQYILEIGGFPGEQTIEQVKLPFINEYSHLRIRLQVHIDEQRQPDLLLLQSQAGGIEGLKRELREAGSYPDEPDRPDRNVDVENDWDPFNDDVEEAD
jgi:hypothetical protein